MTALVALVAAAGAPAALAQSEGGLYIAGAGFGFQVAAERALSQNAGGRRFFLLSVPPETAALLSRTTGPRAALRDRVVAANGVLLVCQRDIDNGKLSAAGLVPGVVAGSSKRSASDSLSSAAAKGCGSSTSVASAVP